ncbi:MAG: hypothetical protein Q7V88_05245 [Actinomycetota bacterium]|nr:hypothetical protein [Actinomycetota bacterium]
MNSSLSTDLHDLAPTAIAAEYERRRLHEVPDSRLVAVVAAAIAAPRQQPADSFVLHAPLELAARAALLPMVHSDQRRLARMRIVAVGAQYLQYEPYAPCVAGPGSSGQAAQGSPATASAALQHLCAALTAGDLAATDAAAVAVAAVATRAQVVAALAPVVAPLTGAAAHAPIYLFQLLRRDALLGPDLRLLRPLMRELARHPDWRIEWIDGWRPKAPTDPGRLSRALADLPVLGVPGSSFIHPLMMQVDRSGVAEGLLGPVLGHRTPAAERAVLRLAASSMLHEPAEHARYGWTHCLTLPQALLGTTSGTAHADLGLALAATHVAAFRAALGTPEGAHRIRGSLVGDANGLINADSAVDADARPDTDSAVDAYARPDADSALGAYELATAAATRHDAHVVKYCLACLDAADDDPVAAGLYLAAARRLLDVWADDGGDPTDPLAATIAQ